MDAVPFCHDHPPLPPDAVIAAAGRAFSLPLARGALFRRAFHDTYSGMDAQGGTVFLRLYRPGYWSDEEIAAEMDILQALQAAGQPVAAPRTIPGGGPLARLALEGRSYQAALFPALAGTAPAVPDTETARRFAAALARLHREMDRLNTHRRYRQDADSLKAFILPPLQALLAPAAAGRLRECLSACLSALAAIPAEKPFFGLCHGDTHAGNWLSWNGEIRFLDFDHCGHMWRIHDLAVALWDAATFSAGINAAALAAALTGGYETVRPLADSERAALLPTCALRHLWWAALHVRMGRRDAAFARKAVGRAGLWLEGCMLPLPQ